MVEFVWVFPHTAESLAWPLNYIPYFSMFNYATEAAMVNEAADLVLQDKLVGPKVRRWSTRCLFIILMLVHSSTLIVSFP